MNKEMKCILKNQMTIMAVLRDVATDHNKDGYIRSLNDRRAETNLLLNPTEKEKTPVEAQQEKTKDSLGEVRNKFGSRKE